MKKIAFIGITVAMAMGFAACQKENLSEEQLISETFTATLGQEATKITISSDAKTVEWAAGDNVYYYTADAGTVRNFTAAAAGSSATLTLVRETGNISVDPAAVSPVAAFSGTGEYSITVTIATPAAGTYYVGVIPNTYSNGLRMVLRGSLRKISRIIRRLVRFEQH